MTKPTKNQASPILVGVDDGFAMTDVVVMEAGKVVQHLAIPSRARSGIHGTSLVTGATEDIAPIYETEGVQFTVGDMPDAESARFDDYPFSPMNRCIVHHALRMAGLGGKDVVIATGLPLSRFYKGDSPNQEVIDLKIASLIKPVAAIDGSPMANIVGHRVFPEGLAAWVDYAVDESSRLRVGANETIGVIDIGGKTTDCAVVLPGRRIDHARCGSADAGALNVVESVCIGIAREFNGVQVGGSLVEQALRDGQIKLWGKSHDIRHIIDAAVNQTADSVLREVNRRLGSGYDLDKVLLVGGGAYIFGEYVKSKFPHTLVPESPELANARGFAKYLSL